MASGDFALYRLSGTSQSELSSAVDVLLVAYAEDRAIEALSGGDKHAAALLFRRSLEAAVHAGECYLSYSKDVLCGVVAWVAPGSDWRFQEDAAFVETLPVETRDWYSQHYIPKYEELYRSGGFDSSNVRHEAWKLEWLGVLPQHRNKGIGKALLQTVCGKADRERNLVVAEVTNPSQVNYLQHFGFQHRSVKNMSCGNFPGFPIWCVVREPGGSLVETPRSRRGSAQSHLSAQYPGDRSDRLSPRRTP